MKALLLNVETGNLVNVDMDDNNIKQWYVNIGNGCRGCDHLIISFDGIEYSILADDEGLLKGVAIPSIIDSKYNVLTVGNVLIMGRYEYENEHFVSMTAADCEIIRSHLLKGRDNMGNIRIVLKSNEVYEQ